VRKDATASIIATGARTKLRLDLYDRKREFLKIFRRTKPRKGVRFNAAARSGLSVALSRARCRYDDIERGRRTLDCPPDTRVVHDYDTEAMLRLSWEAYRNFVASAEAGYLTRSGDRVYDGEWLAFRLSYTF
jgi:transposase InsO family protein